MFKPRLTLRLPVLLPALALIGLQTTLHAVSPVSPPVTTPIDISSISQLIIFGDSLSDVGNDADAVDDSYGFRFPGPSLGDVDASLDYTDGRFTDGTDTTPQATLYAGVWHEQLAKLFLGLPVAKASMDGGFDYAGGGATTADGQSTLSEGEGAASLSIQVDNMGRQVSNYLNAYPAADPAALYILWGGANDLFNDDDDSTVTTAVTNEVALVQKLATAGAQIFLVPNLPPLGATPDYNTDPTSMITQKASDFRDQLNTALDTLQASLPGITIYRLDVFTLFQRLENNMAAYGFTDITHVSQGTSENPDHRLFWDGVHPTTAGHYQLAAEAYTLLTGVPVIEINPEVDNSGFWITRTGTDVSSSVQVHYTLQGNAVEGTDYTGLDGLKRLRPNKQTERITVTPTAAAVAGERVKLKLVAEPAYALPVDKKAVITLN